MTRLVVVLVGAALVSGCSGSSDDPAPVEVTEMPVVVSPSESPSATPTPTETAAEASALPPLPDAAMENTAEGAEAFIRYYIDVANLALTTPDATVLPPLAHPDCQSCRALEARATELLADGQQARFNAYDIESMAVVGGTSDDVAVFNMVVDLPANIIVDSSGRRVAESSTATYRGEGAARWVDGAWLLFGLNLQP